MIVCTAFVKKFRRASLSSTASAIANISPSAISATEISSVLRNARQNVGSLNSILKLSSPTHGDPRKLFAGVNF